MIWMILVFLVLMMGTTMAYGAWSAASDTDRVYVLKLVAKTALAALVSFAFLFIVVNLF